MKTAIEMAREAGICTWLKPPEDVTERIERFADLIRADERERLLSGVEMPEPDGMDDDDTAYYTADQLREYAAAAVARKDAEIDALYKHGFQIQDERDALKAENLGLLKTMLELHKEVERLQAAALTNTQIDAPLAEERRRQALEAANKGETK